MTPEDIIDIVDRMESGRSGLHSRMDEDLDRYHLKPYAGELDENGEDTLAGYKKFTSNDPQTVMNLALHLGTTAKLIIRVHQPRAQNTQRELNNQKELYSLGVLSAGDQLREKVHKPSLKDSLFAQSLFRGRIAQRVLLVKEETGETDEFGQPETRTHVDITDWDPRNTYWSMGKDGLDWACEKSYKSRDAIIKEYGIDPAKNSDVPISEDDYEIRYAVYDWFDRETNRVIIENEEEAKTSTRHGMGVVPVAISFADLRPRFQAGEDDYDEFYGESLYKADRAVFDEQNFLYSVLSELASRSIKQPLVIMSRDGSLTLPGDPRVSGEETSLSTANEESIQPLPPMEVIQEFGTLLGITSAMMQRGSFHSAAFGELSIAISGFAITQLNQNILASMTPHFKAVENAYKQILNILCDAYSGEATGNVSSFDVMTLSGRQQDPEHTFFSQSIEPEAIRQAGIIEVELVANLPQDDMSRVTLAQALREGPMPLADDRFIREMMQFQDPQQMERSVWEQMAKRGSDVAVAFNSMIAAEQQGDNELALMWEIEYQIALMQKYIEQVQLRLLGGGGGLNEQNGGGNGAAPGRRAPMPRSSVMPPQGLGINARPNPQAGPLVPPGTPRPGARRENQPQFGPGAVPPFAR